MYLLTIAVVLLALLALLNLSVTFAMIRRLGRVERGGSVPPDVGGLPVGAEVPGFEATAADGSAVTSDSLAGQRTLVAFYSTNCTGCRTQAPEFAQEAGRLAAAGMRVLPVLMRTGAPRDEATDDDLRELLARTGTLVVEEGVGALTTTFAARATPSYFAVGPDGRIAGKGLSVAECLAGSPS